MSYFSHRVDGRNELYVKLYSHRGVYAYEVGVFFYNSMKQVGSMCESLVGAAEHAHHREW